MPTSEPRRELSWIVNHVVSTGLAATPTRSTRRIRAQTSRDPAERAKEIGGTGVPGDFVVAYKEHVPDCVATERRIHRELAIHRYSPRREFFKLSLEVAIARVSQIAVDERARWSPPSSDAIDVDPGQRMATVAIDSSATSNVAPTVAPSIERAVDSPSRASWGLLSGLVLAFCILGALCTAIAVEVSIEKLAASSGGGDAVAGAFATVVLVGGCVGITELLRRAAKKLRSRQL